MAWKQGCNSLHFVFSFTFFFKFVLISTVCRLRALCCWETFFRMNENVWVHSGSLELCGKKMLTVAKHTSAFNPLVTRSWCFLMSECGKAVIQILTRDISIYRPPLSYFVSTHVISSILTQCSMSNYLNVYTMTYPMEILGVELI